MIHLNIHVNIYIFLSPLKCKTSGRQRILCSCHWSVPSIRTVSGTSQNSIKGGWLNGQRDLSTLSSNLGFVILFLASWLHDGCCFPVIMSISKANKTKCRRKTGARHMCPFLFQNKNFPKFPAGFSSHGFASGDVISYHQQQEELGRQVSNQGRVLLWAKLGKSGGWMWAK